MRAGELRHRVTVWKALEVDDTHGGFQPGGDVALYARLPARVDPLSGRELERAQQIEPRTTHRIVLRYRPDITAGLTLTYHDDFRGDRDFEIVAPPLDPGERHRDLELLCREAAAP